MGRTFPVAGPWWLRPTLTVTDIPDYLLYNPVTRQTAIWYMDNNVYVIGVYGRTLPVGWTLVGQ